MHDPEKLSLTHLKSIVNQFEEKGISSVFLTGGEPLSRYDDLLELVRYVSRKCQVWIFTSGFGLTEKRCAELKKAGLIGALVSIDHFDESHHNEFRGHQTSFSKAVDGVKNAQKAGLLTALSVCITREFVSKKNLKAYMDFAKELGVAFVQFFEPRLEGKFEKNGELLSAKQVQLVEEFFLTFNDDPKNVEYPTIIYQGYHQRRKGCHGAGKRYLYIDSNGSINACPFCPNKIGNTENGVVSYTTGACKSFVLNAS
jgi:MoaA/NifB/PqqE/SkfB family radical SAM enzyme